MPISVREQVDYFASELRQRHAARANQRDAAKPTDPDLYIRRAARIVRRLLLRQFKTDPRWDGYDWDEDLQALAEAEYGLLRKIGYEDLPAFGWPGAPGARTRDATTPRIRIPPDLCKGPLSLDKNGMLLPCLQSDDPVSVAPLFWGILIPAEPLLVTWPNPERPQEDAARETSVPFEKRRKPGRTPTHDWPPFDQELVRRVALDAGHIRRGELIRSMKAWAADNMRTEPDDRTVERRVADLVPRGGAIPD